MQEISFILVGIILGMMLLLGIINLFGYIVTKEDKLDSEKDVLDVENPYKTKSK